MDPSRSTFVAADGIPREADIDFNADLSPDKKYCSKRVNSVTSSVLSSSNKGEEIVCRICLGTEEEGTDGEDG